MYECVECKVGTTGPPRLRCIVPFCNHTRGRREGEDEITATEEWICGDHWRAIPMMLRRSKSIAYRAYARHFGREPFWNYPPGSPDRIACINARNECEAAWEAAKSAAIERGMGI